MPPTIDVHTRDEHGARLLRTVLDASDPQGTSAVRILTEAALLQGPALAPRCLLHEAGLTLDQRIGWASARADQALSLHVVSNERWPHACADPTSGIVGLPRGVLEAGAQPMRQRLAQLHGMSVRHVIVHADTDEERMRLVRAAQRCALVSGPASLLGHLIARERIAGRMPFAPSPPSLTH